MNWLTQGVEFHGKALVLRAQRAEVLAANIANADTPNYKSKDMDFGAALQRSMQTGNQNCNLTGTSVQIISWAIQKGLVQICTRQQPSTIKLNDSTSGTKLTNKKGSP